MLSSLKMWCARTTSNVEDPLYEYATTGKVKYLEQVIERYQSDLFHFLKTQTQAASAEDICQKTWLKVIEKNSAYRQQGHPKAYLFQIARNLLVDSIRASDKLSELTDNKVGTTSTYEFTKVSEQSWLYQQIATLPFLQKEALSLQLEGFSLAEIAQIVGAAQETVKTRIRYAKETIKSQVSENNE
ncbi:sigma-70 family RNA polymerase sigma factor [Pseudoalteromonas piscicida]|uniref:Sigma-70 family RNA polymerase sigma factor n=1 Tax=Pseudoalteromonas piscicida TaxID=43662 RepID=A0AAD0RJJ5_PSEO7|nr:sigma-70 family RNA polymerase sigma factor [Pseudoalteromonas piscicida]ASD66267.1 RNA polymerase subunit sigma-24 [Pseudoalteromonas piscicida]AXR03024.1 sigma-70 family RNA polymerase sigma factor [Pseudoalteromonas piscicida]